LTISKEGDGDENSIVNFKKSLVFRNSVFSAESFRTAETHVSKFLDESESSEDEESPQNAKSSAKDRLSGSGSKKVN
jgi:hypothetical protein